MVHLETAESVLVTGRPIPTYSFASLQAWQLASMAEVLHPEHLVAKSVSPQLPHSPSDEQLRQETLKVLGIAGESMAPDPMLNSMCKTITRLMDVPIAGEPSLTVVLESRAPSMAS